MSKNTKQTMPANPLDYWDDFENAKKAEGLKDYTLRKYHEELGVFQRYLLETGKTPCKKTVQEFITSLREKGLSASRTRNYWVSLKSLYSWAENDGRIDADHNPMKGIQGPKRNKIIIETYSDVEMNQMLANLETLTYKTIISLFWKTGCRESELLRLKYSDVNLGNQTLHIHGKGAKDRIVPFDDRCLNHLRQYFENRTFTENEIIFKVKAKELRRVVRESCDAARIRQRNHPIHCFRHSFACNYLMAGGNPLDLMYILGHSSLAMTNHYSQWVASARAVNNYHKISHCSIADADPDPVAAFVNELPELDGLEYSEQAETTGPQNEQETAKSFMGVLCGLLNGENQPMLRQTEQWGDICRDKPEIELTEEQRQDLRSWAYTMITFSGVVDRITDVVERAVHLGYWYAKQEDTKTREKERIS